jgi:hypothetical protein
MPVGTPTVFVGVTLFGASLATNLTAGVLSSVSRLLAVAAGTNTSFLSVQSTQYVLAMVLAFPGVASAAGVGASSIMTALAAATGAGGSGPRVTLQVLGVNAGGVRRLLSSIEATVLAYSANSSVVLAFNATLFSVVDNGSLTRALQAAGVNTTAATLSVPPVTGLQLNLGIQCPTGFDAKGTALPNATAMVQNVSPGALDASTSLLMSNLSSAGLGNISSVVVSLSPTVGAFCMRVAAAAATERHNCRRLTR